MKAEELKRKYIKKSKLDGVTVIGILQNSWYHIHHEEEIPTEDVIVALKIDRQTKT